MVTPIDYLKVHSENHINELCDFLRIKSISSIAAFSDEMMTCANRLNDILHQIGLENVKCIATEGYPAVYGEWIKDPAKPTVLIYGHYDVQPAEPYEMWHTDPFEPVIENNCIYARGASDNKGQIFMHLKVLEAFLKSGNAFPLNVKVLIEGEEEIGSPNLPSLLDKFHDMLSCDFVFISDTAMIGENMPAICYGLRGLLEFKVEVQGPSHNLPSGGFYGGNVQNPAHIMAHLVNSLHTSSGKVAVEGFYADVQEISSFDRRHFSKLPFSESELKDKIKVSELVGEEGYSVLERAWSRPTLEVNQMVSGYYGDGHQTIIPSQATAYITCRLVANQDPDTIWRTIQDHFAKEMEKCKGVTVSLELLGRCKPYTVDYKHKWINKCAEALEQAFEVPVSFIKAGGSIPIVELLSTSYQVPILLVGFGLPDANVHGPNERFSLDHFRKGTQALCYFWNSFL
ncbi:dipeptidase [Paenibacillus barengoltzii]|uniref:dipeptidase n=1 Tax=Paenibacillus barengoltzii TaxID=343517 RepID=UPI002DBF3C1C|nr:dipeptidase [Paenibacillus barengoltzii]MEC2346697.1 dipeptidase [Paenibacillus barengoltzii]